MVLRRICIIGGLLVSLCFAQNELFFTDSYHTNLYKGSNNQLIFHNNLLPFLNDSGRTELQLLFENFGKELQVSIKTEEAVIQTQYIFSFSGALNPIDASKKWHQEYENLFKKIASSSLSAYFISNIPVVSSVESLALQKLAYENFINFNERSSDFSGSTIHIILNQFDVAAFNNAVINPNLSLNRIVTNSTSSFYNESFVLRNEEDKSYFFYGPSNKAKFEECIAMVLFCKINDVPEPKYFNKESFIQVPNQFIAKEITQNIIDASMSYLSSYFSKIVNNPFVSFYNLFDKEHFQENLEKFTLEDYNRFIEIYLTDNNSNVALSLDSAEVSFNQRVLKDSIHFKTNSIILAAKTDSILLNKIALFLVNNTKVSLDIVGYYGEQEYTKIDQNLFKKLVNQYKETPPVKVSKKPNLAIYRAVVVFDYLVKKGVSPKQLFCLSGIIKGENTKFSYAKFDIKL